MSEKEELNDELLTGKEKAKELLRLMEEFETFLLSKSGEIDLEKEGWRERIIKMFEYADSVWKTTRIEAFQAVSWWLGNIEKSYMNKYDVKIGLVNLQGEQGFKQWVKKEMSKVQR